MGIDLSQWLAAQGDSEFTQQVEQIGKSAEEDKREKAEQKRLRSVLKLHPTGQNFASLDEPGFVNPYTFFPIEDEAPWRELPSVDYGGHTGKLVCTLEVRADSALFIPNTTGCFMNGDHKSYDFFSHDDLSADAALRSTLPDEPPSSPLVPGSELRGMVRSVYEQLTNSCLPIIDEKSKPIKRTSLPKEPYRMEFDAANRCWKLYETEVFRLGDKRRPSRNRGSDDVLKAYQVVYVTPRSGKSKKRGSKAYVEISSAGAPGSVEAYVHLTGSMHKKRTSLFPVENAYEGEEPLCTISADDGLMERFERVLDAYCTKSTEANHNEAMPGYIVYRDRYRSGQTVLVYADDGNNPRFLSPSCMSPESFDTTVLDLLQVQAGHSPCKGPAYCPACRLFGAVGDERSVGSRVRFGDGEPDLQYGVKFDGPTTLAPLSSPRVSATEFYLKQPSPPKGMSSVNMWNFDYVLQGNKKAFPYKEMEDAGVQGRKVYLHFPFNLRRGYEPEVLQPSSQNITVRPLKRGKFSFPVFFENLSDEELANLIFAIGGMGEGRLQKLGHGKPLGMGSVLVRVERCETRAYEFADGRMCAVSGAKVDAEWVDRTLAEIDSSVLDGKRAAARRKLIEIHARHLSSIPLADGRGTLGDVVSYPKLHSGRIGKNNAIFEWFGKNRGRVTTPEKTAIAYTLSPLSVEAVMEKAGGEGAWD